MAELKKDIESKCIHCHLCRDECDFLSKYQLDIGDVDALSELAFHCFLCGKCSRVCPEGIDGKEVVLTLRKMQVEKSGEKILSGQYGGLLKEKKNYIYRNYKHSRSGSVLFMGCNFPSYYPKTTKWLSGLLLEKAGIGTVYDCCGKPIAELGMSWQETQIIQKIEDNLNRCGVAEVIMVCPNCYYFLKGKLSIPIVSIYDKLRELSLGNKIEGGFPVFLPCPDRESLALYEGIQPFLEKKCMPETEVQCCGLGGCARGNEPDLAAGMAKKLREKQYRKIYVYCASCGGSLARNGCRNTSHVLCEILGTNEKPDTGKSILNRMKTRFI